MAGVDVNRGAKRAREARRDLRLDPAAPLGCILTEVEDGAGLPVVVAALPDHVAGACYREGGGTVLWVNGAQAAARQRFTLAHELGHARCGHDGTLELDTWETLSGRTTSAAEIEANAFAAEFLVPRAGLAELVAGEPTLEEVVMLATHYGVSAIMVVYRLRQLRLASAPRLEQLEREVSSGLHHSVSDWLRLVPRADRLGRLDHLPYLSPALEGTAISAALHGEPSGDRAVAAATRRLLA